MSEAQEVRVIAEGDLARFVEITAHAYPGMKIATQADRDTFREQLAVRGADPSIHLYGLYRESELLGGMVLYDFDMTLYETRAGVGGVGMVGVDALHKKEHVARDLVAAYLRHYREKSYPLAALYPFRPDFYAAMGFGYGTKINGYRVTPSAFLPGGDKSRVRFMTPEDHEKLVACYERYAGKTHGMFRLSDLSRNRFLSNPDFRVVGYERDGEVRGYFSYRLNTPNPEENFVLQDLHIQQWVYETPEALQGLTAYLRSQADQVRRVIFYTFDESFFYALSDPRNGTDRLLPPVNHESNVQGVGLMYRIINLRRFFELLAEHDFGGETLTLKLSVRDSFLPEENGDTVVRFERGRVRALDADPGTAPDVTVDIGVAELSSLLMGCVPFASLYQLGLASISDVGRVEQVERLFRAARKPICLTPF